MGNIAIITARGGSKRIPGKNIKEFCGKPILAYSIQAALESELFSEVMVSTDSLEIAEIAKKYGAVVPFMRSDKTSDDFATTGDVLLEVLEEYGKRKVFFEYMCCIYPTAPFVTADKLKSAMKLMKEEKSVEVLPVVAFSYPPQRCFVINQNGKLTYKYKEFVRSRSQDLEPLYHDAGQFYLYDVKQFRLAPGMITEGMTPMVVPETEVQDIDNLGDWTLAEMKYRHMVAQID